MEQKDRLFTAQVRHVATSFDLTHLVVAIERKSFIDLETELFTQIDEIKHSTKVNVRVVMPAMLIPGRDRDTPV